MEELAAVVGLVMEVVETVERGLVMEVVPVERGLVIL